MKNGGALPALRVDPERTKVLQKMVAVSFASRSDDVLRDVVRAAKGRRPRDAKEPAAEGALGSSQGFAPAVLLLGEVEARVLLAALPPRRASPRAPTWTRWIAGSIAPSRPSPCAMSSTRAQHFPDAAGREGVHQP